MGGIVPWLLSIGKNKDISGRQRWLLSQAGILHKGSCPKCNGSGLGEQAAHTWIAGRTISELEQMPISELGEFLKSAEIKPSQLLTEVMTKLDCLMDVGLHHLALARPIPTLSGGELQRLFLASTIIADMDSMIFVFDEPTIGLHEIEKQKLMDIIKGLVKRGNTVVAVEHDATFMRCADYLIDLGPEEFLGCRASKTAPYLTSESERDIRTEFRPVVNAKKLRIENATRHNLQQVTVEFPLGVMVGIAGVSGSGKSSLLSDTLVPKLKEVLHPKEKDDEEDGDDEEDSGVRLYGTEYLNKCLVIDQKPIGGSRLSCPATYTGMFDRVRALYAKESGLPAGRFSVNAEGGCIFCKGEGVVHYPVGFGQYVDVECDSCGGSGFTAEAMQVKVDGQTIRDILAMTVDEATAFFQGKDKQIGSMLTTLQRVGMGYLTLGQKTPTISGGESQRIKLAKELAKGVNAKDCLYVAGRS
ncbi:hypothetical protein [Gorillibacterium sp. CAU 1737]|uniref:hypothetical protein n=1 Tax=Gorillibacterium sp. CAU 1737 TaxID=3140362 RepID=UPI003261A94A